jgi:hypothetical protein
MLNALRGLHINTGTHAKQQAFGNYLLGFHLYLLDRVLNSYVELFGCLNISAPE